MYIDFTKLCFHIIEKFVIVFYLNTYLLSNYDALFL